LVSGNEKKFFIPFVRESFNKETYSMALCSDLTIPMIGYGIPYNYRCYDLDELIASFVTYTDNELESLGTVIVPFVNETKFVSKVRFQLPGDSNTTLSTYTINNIIAMLPELITVNKQLKKEDIDMYINFINKCLEMCENQDEEIKQIKLKFNSLTIQDKEKMKTFFELIFITGMYMRRWDGKGPYPLKKEQTLGKEPLNTINNYYGKIQHCMDSFSDNIINLFFDKKWGNIFETRQVYGQEMFLVNPSNFKGLKLQLRYGNTYETNGYINELLIQLMRSKACIRVGSKTLVDTSVFYMKTLFNIRKLQANEIVESIS
jgi:hypothetical protein